MCNQIETNNMCKITKKICPYMYFCSKTNSWKPQEKMPEKCKILESQETKTKSNTSAPKGYYTVKFERKGFLYVEIKGFLYKFKNIFDKVPSSVKVTKQRGSSYILKDAIF